MARMESLKTKLEKIDQRDEREAFEMGRKGLPVTEKLLEAKVIQYDEALSAFHREYASRKQVLDRRLGVGVKTNHAFALFVGAGVFVAALFVDYAIIKEFWTRVLANEFMEIPPALADSVIFKSAQVVFATLAVHFLLKAVGPVGRGAFAIFIFLLTAMMVLGIGLLVANKMLPPGSELFGVQIHQTAQSADQTLQALGLAAPAQPVAAPADAPFTQTDVKTFETMVWLGSLSVVFMIVTGVGAMSLHAALRAFEGLTGGAVYDHQDGEGRTLSIRDEKLRVAQELKYLESASARMRLIHKKIADFVSAYTQGFLEKHNLENEKHAALLDRLETTAGQIEAKWNAEFIRERYSNEPKAPEIETADAAATEDEKVVRPSFGGRRSGSAA